MPPLENLGLAEARLLPFSRFAGASGASGPLRDAISAHYRAPEPDCVAQLLPLATLPEAAAEQAGALARRLVEALRRKGARSAVQELLHEFALSSQEGVALMCLAEGLLRIPDSATRDALIRDKIGGGDWRAHLGHSPSLFVNAATWSLVVTGRLVATSDETGLSHALSRLIGRGGEPVIRAGVDLAMRMLGQLFVMGETIEAALTRARKLEAKGFGSSYDMLGEAALTAADAERYYGEYEAAMHAVGRHAAGRGPYAGPGISIKLSALHPRYTRAHRDRVMAELLPRVAALAGLAKGYDLGLNIDAEEANRLDLSLDLLEALCSDDSLAGWNGLGFVVQAYAKRAPFVLDWTIDLARRSGHRLMLRLVKGAYWDTEIKRAQVDGMPDYPVFTRKVHTDLCYQACARKLLDARDAVFPQFATHNAQSLAAVFAMAGPDFAEGDWEFQCLHGMGEPLYDEVVGPDRLDRPCRIYAPVGAHATLFAYLVRRLLENGANTSFVNRIQNEVLPLDALIADPASVVASEAGPASRHVTIKLPAELFGPRRQNSGGLDLADERVLAALQAELPDWGRRSFLAPVAVPDSETAGFRAVRNPADHRDVVGRVAEATPQAIERALAVAEAAAPEWGAVSPQERAGSLFRAADLLEQRRGLLINLLVREAGRTVPNALSEIREAVDFLRYYGAQVRDLFDNATHPPLGPAVCISPWNFPLAIFTGQVAAALAAGNPVLAKPAEETPLIAVQAVAILHEAGVPEAALQLVPGNGTVGAALVADRRTRAVLFTGSTSVAKLIQAELAKRLNPGGAPVPLIAETAGQNAMIVDSSALAEQVVTDAVASAFDSAGQRCSALRVLCVQEDVAERVLTMLRGAMAELAVGNPDRLTTDIGPVITDEARDAILAHIERMRAAGHAVHQAPLPEPCRFGSFVPPTVLEIESLAELDREVFGPVLHVLRFRRDDLDRVIDAINATGYALTFGVHSRIDETIARVTRRVRAGNVYVNRNIIGAVVGVQPFGGHCLSGTGPKAGGPLTLRRLLASAPVDTGLGGVVPEAGRLWAEWLAANGEAGLAAEAGRWLGGTPVGALLDLPGPTGEHNRYATEPRGTVLCVGSGRTGLLRAISAAMATGNRAAVPPASLAALPRLPPTLAAFVTETAALSGDAIVFAGDDPALLNLAQDVAAVEGPIAPILRIRDGALPLDLLVVERATSVDTTASGGNASLMTLAEAEV